MRRWGDGPSRLKWLRPGMGVKRWVFLLIGGLVLLGFGGATLPHLIDASAWSGFVQRLGSQESSLELLVAGFLVLGGSAVGVAVFGLSHSLLSPYRRINRTDVAEVVYRYRQRQRGPKVVAIGGGHGLNTLLRGLKEHTDNITAIVTVTDDGGSSGRLRRDLGILPPGDFRNCLAALSDAEGLLSELFQYRFGDDSDLEGHSFGNLYLTAMTAITGSFEAALRESSRILAVRGRVIPSTLAQVTLYADVAAGPATAGAADGRRWQRIYGESQITAARGRILRVYLEPEDAPAYPEAIRAILDADLIVAGPGSLYTSVLPNLLVGDLAQALASALATKVYVCNVATQAGETERYDVSDHVRTLREHVPYRMAGDPFHIVLANDNLAGDPPPGEGVDWVRLPRAEVPGCRLVARDLVDLQRPWRHDPSKLAQALLELLEGAR